MGFEGLPEYPEDPEFALSLHVYNVDDPDKHGPGFVKYHVRIVVVLGKVTRHRRTKRAVGCDKGRSDDGPGQR